LSIAKGGIGVGGRGVGISDSDDEDFAEERGGGGVLGAVMGRGAQGGGVGEGGVDWDALKEEVIFFLRFVNVAMSV